MLRGLYTSVSSMITNEKRQAVITNNLANINTIGYKNEKLISKSFDEVSISNRDKFAGGKGHKQVIGNMSLGVAMDDVVVNYTQGVIKQTGNKMDVAISGKGFFKVSDKNGQQFYTRNGNFREDTMGNLITSDGYYVLGTNIQTGAVEPIQVNGGSFEVSRDNTISINNTPKYKFNIVDIEDYATLNKVGNNVYTGDGEVAALGFETVQNSVETSNVDMIAEVSDMMMYMREYEASQKIIQTIDSTLEKIANQIGAV
ncbi:flagellar hook-basal body complex protein [Clostridioides mangenotii]|uniref:flagellar hook-basal body complex protein n=1 Tax=Metaclostridioides mangenotii TaxID=1540 RepID=UPI001C1061C6|nr:flagellar hook-basal body complex protein [Clostridioides mangenotii]MBU5307826.1 flagellar hook-basal body complex protein [Clostridioides mangenotii]MCR1953948.1 flagellar hook-basal body complex protein [Clostridioides mangenotii]